MTTLTDLAIQQILFFANVSDTDVHPDVAVGQLEQLVAALNDLEAPELTSVRDRVREMLAEASDADKEALIELDSMLR